jgi:Zn finger protein HypA/HybF involved in hydrogenase expression
VREHYSVEELKEAVASSFCMSDVCRKLNVTVCTFNFKRIDKLLKEHSVSKDHFDVKKTFRRNKVNWSEADVFCKDSLVHRSQLRQHAKRIGLYNGKCSSCGGSDMWQGRPLTLELDHINGINDDNRKENLRWLCPNCHTQTPTHKNSSNRRGVNE